jgi:cysteinyl-tRNA synthetase
MNYDPEEKLTHPQEKERYFKEFFSHVKGTLRNCHIDKLKQKFNDKDFELQNHFEESQINVHDALCDNFNTPKAIHHLAELVSKTNTYMNTSHEIKLPLVKTITRYVFKILKCFGLYEEEEYPNLVG